MPNTDPLFASFVKEAPELQAEISKSAIAADLTVLAGRAGLSHAEIALRVGWTQELVDQVLSGIGPMSIEHIHSLARSLGYKTEVTFRKA